MTRGAILVLALACASCGFQGPDVQSFATPIPTRHGTILVNACALDAGQSATLSAAATKTVAQEVVLVCGAFDNAGNIGTYDGTATSALSQQIAAVKQQGYTVRVAVGLAQGVSQSTITAMPETWANAAVASVAAFPVGDGLELAINQPDAYDLLAPLVHPIRTQTNAAYIGALVAAPDPSEGLDASYWLNAGVNRLRILTVDFSQPGNPGPALDSGWAVDVAASAQAALPGVPIDVAVPLVGTDFQSSPGGANMTTVPITFADAESTAAAQGVVPARGPTGTLHFAWTTPALNHEAWFDDATSISLALHAWDTTTLSPDVGVVFYGLGGEDPALFSTIAEGMQ